MLSDDHPLHDLLLANPGLVIPCMDIVQCLDPY